MYMQKKTYSADIKLKAVLRLPKGGATCVELAKEIGCHNIVHLTVRSNLERFQRLW
jgi:transposase-like protein